MKKTLFFLLQFVLITSVLKAQAVFGVPNINDAGHKMIPMSDGNYLVAGLVDNDAALYKINCQGEIMDSLRKDLAVLGSYEAFTDVIELPNGEYIAAGYAKVFQQIDMVILLRVNSNLDELAFDTLKINNKNANGVNLSRDAATGTVYLVGTIDGTNAFDFTDVFVVPINTSTLQQIGNAKVFSLGLDGIRHTNTTSDGNLLISGVSVVGNIFFPENLITNLSYVRKIKPDGTLLWQVTRTQVIKNKWGRAYFDEAVENPLNGHILVSGRRFMGDTVNNQFDPFFLLLAANGTVLDTNILIMPGNQETFHTKWNTEAQVFMSLGDSSTVSYEGVRSQIIVSSNVINDLYQLSTTVQTLPISGRSMVLQSGARFSTTGVLFHPQNGTLNQDAFVGIAGSFTTQIQQNGADLTLSIPESGIYTYQWSKDGLLINGANSNSITVTMNGVYSVLVTNAFGCTRTASMNVVVAPIVLIDTIPLYNLAYDTICIGNNLSLSAIINDAVSYQWNFGDGTMSTAHTPPAHQYAMQGNYIVSLNITTAPATQKIVTAITVNSSEPANFELFDLTPDPYIIIKNNLGQEVYRSLSLNNDTAPFTIPVAVLFSNQTYLIEIWDYDFFDTDDFMGSVFINNPTTGGTFTFGQVSITFTTLTPSNGYHWQTAVHVFKPAITYNVSTNLLSTNLGSVTPVPIYTWQLNGLNIPNSNFPTWTPTSSGQYTVNVNASYCQSISDPITVMLGSPCNVSLSLTTSNATCNAQNGSITVNPTGGASPYSYKWSTVPIQNSPTATNLAQGTYTVTVTDVNGCTQSATKIVLQIGSPSIMLVATNVTCFGGLNGSITSTVTGGVSPYSYQWSTVPIQNSPTATNLAQGTYTVTVTDVNGCTQSATKIVLQIGSPSIMLVATNVTCFGGLNGSITSTVTGGVSPYSYQWSTVPIQNGPTATNLAQGTYTVTTTDANGCTSTASTNLLQPPVLFVLPQQGILPCPGISIVTLTLDPIGGTPPYSYLWGNSATTQSITVNLAGAYLYSVTDAVGCASISSALVTDLPPLQSVTTVSPENGNNLDGTIDLTVNGGIAPYSYQWSNGASTEDLVGLEGNMVYTVTITDINLCTTIISILVDRMVATQAVEWPSKIKLAPNPADEQTYLNLDSVKFNNLIINLLDINGRFCQRLETFDKTHIPIDCSSLPSGVYLLEILHDRKRSVLRLLVQH